MKVALVQMNSGADKNENIRRALNFVEQACRRQAGAEFVLLPEIFHYRGPAKKEELLKRIAEEIPGESSAPFLELARKEGVFILLGSIYEKYSRRKQIFNTSILIDDRGKITGRYRKQNLFAARLSNTAIDERKTLSAGTKAVLAQVGPLTVGLSICYDLRFPAFYQSYAQKGAQVFLIPSGFTRTTGEAHWEVLLRARAIENLSYVLAPNQCGSGAHGVPSFGNSMIIDPWGKILARAGGEHEEIIYAELDRRQVEEKRKIFSG